METCLQQLWVILGNFEPYVIKIHNCFPKVLVLLLNISCVLDPLWIYSRTAFVFPLFSLRMIDYLRHPYLVIEQLFYK